MQEVAKELPKPVTTKIPQTKTIETKQAPKRKQAPKALIIALIVFSILILIGAAVLGLFWNKWFT